MLQSLLNTPLLIILNYKFQILGILVLIFGGLSWGGMPDEYAIGILVLGGIILIISMFGCCGAVRESPRMLWTVRILQIHNYL